jgi:hypothetical protein
LRDHRHQSLDKSSSYRLTDYLGSTLATQFVVSAILHDYAETTIRRHDHANLSNVWTQELQMMKFNKYVATTFAMGILAVALFGCQKQQGPAERAGKQIDNAVDKTGQQIEKAGDKIEDAAKDAKK